MLAPVDFSQFDIELGTVFESFAYENGNRTDKQEKDENGIPAWKCDLTFYEHDGATALLTRRVKVFQKDKPSVSTRHGLVELIEPSVNFYGRGNDASIWARGLKEKPTVSSAAR